MKVVHQLTRFLRKQTLQTFVTSGDDVRLHLGCGEDYWRGYVNIDANEHVKCDICCDFISVGERFKPASVSEVVMIHSLSYLRLWEARDFFRAVFRLLKPNGRFVAELPDLGKCAQKARDNTNNLPNYIEAVRGLYAFDLDQIAARERFVPYAFGWSGWHLRLELFGAGFGRVEILDPLTHGKRLDRDIRLIATKT
jgi:hypothetical protein